ncbi:MAG: hypothetical protein R2682_07265 [Pyrinomonadaceae bacterium]
MEAPGRHLLIAFFFLFTLTQTALPQGSGSNDNLPAITRSTILDDLKQIRDKEGLSTLELVQRANEMIPQKGTTYVFNICDYIKTNGRPMGRIKTDVFHPYAVRMATADGSPREFLIRVSDPVLGAGCFTQMAVVSTTPETLTVIAGGKPITLNRPTGFSLSKMKMVDRSLKKVIRTWEIPFQLQPVGISPDGLRLYMDAGIDIDEKEESLAEIVLELPQSGAARFRARDQLKLPEGQPWHKQYIRFRHGTRSFILYPPFDQAFMVMMATGMFIPPTPIYPIETKAFKDRNPTSYEFPGSLQDVRQKVISIFKDYRREYYKDFGQEMSFFFTAEERSNALFAKETGIFDDDKNKFDLFLHSFGNMRLPSPLYFGGGKPLTYTADFQLHFSDADPGKTRIQVIAHRAKVFNGTVCCGMHGYMSNVVPVEPTTIEEYKILRIIGEELGLTDMPPTRYPDSVK